MSFRREKRLRVDISEPWKSEFNFSHPIQRDTRHKSAHFEGRRKLRFENSEESK
jgi:hypothetical protein